MSLGDCTLPEQVQVSVNKKRKHYPTISSLVHPRLCWCNSILINIYILWATHNLYVWKKQGLRHCLSHSHLPGTGSILDVCTRLCFEFPLGFPVPPERNNISNWMTIRFGPENITLTVIDQFAGTSAILEGVLQTRWKSQQMYVPLKFYNSIVSSDLSSQHGTNYGIPRTNPHHCRPLQIYSVL
jgi:hypothetical protein